MPENSSQNGATIFLPLIDNGAGSVRANYLISVLRGYKDKDIHIERFSDSLPSRARNRAAAYFLRETQRDYIQFIDTDMIFDQNHTDHMAESDERILAGIYCKKSKGIEPCLNTLPGQEPAQCGGYMEIARAGTGFLRVHRSVLEVMKDRQPIEHPSPESLVELKTKLLPEKYTEHLEYIVRELCNEWQTSPHYVNHGTDEWDFFSVGVINKEYLSEDWFFCDKLRALGFKVILDTRIQVRHEGSAIFPLDEVIEKAAGNVAVTPPN